MCLLYHAWKSTLLMIMEWRWGNWKIALSMCPYRGGALGYEFGSGAIDELSGKLLKGFSASNTGLRTVTYSLDRRAQIVSWVLPHRVSRSWWRWSGWILVTSLLTGVVMGRTQMIWTSVAQCSCSGLTAFISFRGNFLARLSSMKHTLWVWVCDYSFFRIL